MAYLNNIPQGNQTISSSQPQILANFTFIPLAVGQEHNWDPSTAANTYHLKASMPNMADPATPGLLPVGTNGMYYVSGNRPKFYDNNASFYIQTTQVFSFSITGSVVVTNSSAFPVVTLPVNSFGTVNIIGSPATANYYYAGFSCGAIASDARIFNTSTLGLTVTLVGGNQITLQAPVGTYKYLVNYWTP